MSKLETSRLQLRPYEQADLRDALAVLGDPETMLNRSRRSLAAEVPVRCSAHLARLT